jgi:predicted Rossmann fold nucleotide-binding protein DprA/Smf involved in DNA uptake
MSSGSETLVRSSIEETYNKGNLNLAHEIVISGSLVLSHYPSIKAEAQGSERRPSLKRNRIELRAGPEKRVRPRKIACF